MKRVKLSTFLIAAISVLAIGGYLWFFHSSTKVSKNNNTDLLTQTTESSDRIDKPVATVQAVPIKKTTITENIIVYGTVIPAPGAVQAVSLPFESRIHHILVSNGQRVSEGEILLETEPSRDTHLQVEEARNAAESAKLALKHMQERFDLKLSTNQELLQAKQAFKEAQLRLESLEQKGAGQNQQIRATSQAVVNKISVQEGSIVSAGSTLLEIVPQNRFEVRFGVEPEDMKYLRVDQPVSLSSVNTRKSSSVTGRTRAISQSINPATRLIDVFVELPPFTNQFLLDEYIRGKIDIASKIGVVVPRTAVLPEEDGHYVLFTVKDGHAKKHTVQIGLESQNEIEVVGSGFQPGDLVVTLGNYELKDGMVVKAEVTQ
jgi:membrane fusion protein, multidrug efflux system